MSDPLEPALALQGIPWILRKLINLATITMFVKQDVDDSGAETITIDQTASGGIKAETEVRKLDCKYRFYEFSSTAQAQLYRE